MTFQPPPDNPSDPNAAVPPPPPPPPPPVQQGGQWAPPPAPGGGYGQPAAGFDPKSVNRLDWGILGIGFLVFLFSFIAFYDGADVTFNGRSGSVDSGTASAWNDVFGGGFFGWFAMLFGIAGAVVVAMSLFAPQIKLPVANRLLGLGLFAAAALFEIIGIFVTPGASELGTSVSLNHGFGFWASLIFILAGLVLSLARLQQTGGQLPSALHGVPDIGGRFPKN